MIPATWEAETGESLEPGRQKLPRVEIMPLHSSLDDRVKFHLKKNRKTNKQKTVKPYSVLTPGFYFSHLITEHKDNLSKLYVPTYILAES